MQYPYTEDEFQQKTEVSVMLESQADETLGLFLPEPSMQQVVYFQLNLVDFLEKSLPLEGRWDRREKGIKTLVEEPENSTAPLREIQGPFQYAPRHQAESRVSEQKMDISDLPGLSAGSKETQQVTHIGTFKLQTISEANVCVHMSNPGT